VKKEFLIFKHTFDHRGVEARIKVPNFKIQKIVGISKGRQVILTGDFNSLPESDAIQGLTDSTDCRIV